MISMGWGPGLGFLGAHRQDLGQVSGLGLRLQVRDGGPSPLHCREQESQTSDPLCPTSWSEGGRSGSREQHHESQQGSECIPAQDAGGEQGHSALREVRNSGGWVSCPRSPGGSQVFYLPCPGAPLGGCHTLLHPTPTSPAPVTAAAEPGRAATLASASEIQDPDVQAWLQPPGPPGPPTVLSPEAGASTEAGGQGLVRTLQAGA